VRERREFDLEDDLFKKLISIFVTPETLIKWTWPPREKGEGKEDAQPMVAQECSLWNQKWLQTRIT
jgi:hypothetical protein